MTAARAVILFLLAISYTYALTKVVYVVDIDEFRGYVLHLNISHMFKIRFFWPQTDFHSFKLEAGGFQVNINKVLIKHHLLSRYVTLTIVCEHEEHNKYTVNGSNIIVSFSKCEDLKMIIGSSKYFTRLYVLGYIEKDGSKINPCTFFSENLRGIKVRCVPVELPITFDWNNTKIVKLDLPIGPLGTASYRDLRILHMPNGDVIRVNGNFYAVATNRKLHGAIEVLLRSRDLIHWEVIGYTKRLGESDIMLVKTSKGYKVVLFSNPSSVFVEDLSHIECLFKDMEGVVKPSPLWAYPQFSYMAVPYLYKNGSEIYAIGEVLYTHVPGTLSLKSLNCPCAITRIYPRINFIYIIGKVRVNLNGQTPQPILPFIAEWPYGIRTSNPSVYVFNNITIIALDMIQSFFTLLPVLGIKSHGVFVPLPPGTWVENYVTMDRGGNRHETPTIITTQKEFEKGNFWIIWWHNLKGHYWTYRYEALQVGNFKPSDVPSINVTFACRAKPLKFSLSKTIAKKTITKAKTKKVSIAKGRTQTQEKREESPWRAWLASAEDLWRRHPKLTVLIAMTSFVLGLLLCSLWHRR